MMTLKEKYSSDFNRENIMDLIRDVIREPTERPTRIW